MSTVTTKGQATIPREIREYLSLKPGDKLNFSIVAGHVEVTRAETERAYQLGKDVFGRWSSGLGDLSSRKMRKEISAKAMKEKHG